MGSGQMAIINGELFVYNAPTYLTEVLTIDPKSPSYVYKTDTKTLKIADKLSINEKSNVAFAKNSLLIMYSDRIERYNSNFELINNYTLSQGNYSTKDNWWGIKMFAVDEDHILYSSTPRECPTLLNIVTGEINSMPLFVVQGQEFTYVPESITGNSDIVSCYCYKESCTVFINWKTKKIVDMVYPSDVKEPILIKSLSNLTLYELQKSYDEFNIQDNFNLGTDSYSGCYYNFGDSSFSLFDCVNKTKLDFPKYNGKGFYVNSILRAENEQVFLLINLNDKKASICETYLYCID